MTRSRLKRETEEARLRLIRVHYDDVKVNAAANVQKEIIRENHLGPLIMRALRRT